MALPSIPVSLPLFALVSLSLPLAVVVLYVLFAFGNRLLRSLDLQPLQKITFSAGLGLAFVSSLMFALSAAHLLQPIVAWALLLVLLLLALPDFSNNVGFIKVQVASCISFFRRQFKSPFTGTVSLLFLSLVFIQFLAALAPPSSAEPGPKDWDSLVYHFAVPKTYVQNGGFVFLPFPHANWPMGMEMLHAWAFLLYSVILAKLLSFAVGLLLLLAIYSVAKQMVPNASTSLPFVAVLLFSAMPLVQAFWGTGYVDVPLAFFELLSFFALLQWWKHESNDWLLLLAIFAGFSAAVKTLGGFVVLLAVLALLYKLVRSPSRPAFVHRLKSLAVFGAVSSLFFLPWYLKTFLWTGNPTWPLYFGFYKFLGISSAGTEYFTATLGELAVSSQAGAGHGVIDFLLLPFTLTFLGAKFNGVLSPLFLAFLPLLFFVPRWLSDFRKLFLWVFGFTALWFLNFQDARFYLPALALLSTPAAYAYDVLQKSGRLGLVLKASLLGMLLFVVLFTFVYKAQALGVAIGLESQESYLLRTQSNYGTLQWANRNLPPESRIFFFKDIQGYYSDVPYQYFITWDFGKFEDDEALYLRLKAEGFTHVLANENNGLSADARGGRQAAFMDELLKKHGRLEYSYNRVSLYQLAG